MPRPIFRNLVIATAGPLPDQFTSENIQKWTQMRKGSFSPDLTDQVTHLLCTTEQFDERVPTIKRALAKKNKRLHVVHYDWFDDSIFGNKRHKERDYCMRAILSKQKVAEREQGRLERFKREGERGVNPGLFHIYYDRIFFPYSIVLTRDNETHGEPGQRYTLHLWESNAKPHLYWFVAKFYKKKTTTQPSYHRPSPCSGTFDQEMNHFKSFFCEKAGVDWADRVMKQGTTSSSFFQYSPPTGGKPVGLGLRFCYDYCVEVNAQLRGLPWPPVAGEEIKNRAEMDEAGQSSSDAILEDHVMEDVDGNE